MSSASNLLYLRRVPRNSKLITKPDGVLAARCFSTCNRQKLLFLALAELHQTQVTRKRPPPTLTGPEWMMISEVTAVLLPLQKATKAISAEHAPTISQLCSN
jgi:hypothetical protein